ncbi:hypothetical protein [Sphaerisporangium sp. TRM90804]|uniref:hypothetical protein n=1 Tax=Sphaerisporangium sp. TRM90804 TaxID=3031113 RepID=UPI00244C6024|nr:hypothetical protein [Sphaerisporangium sp. TRM90804]MDH2424772.1 hypothetical protein [Sphaerisporangium sp. TRM90804]
MKVYAAVEYDGEGQGFYKVLRAFSKQEDAEAYGLGEEILPLDIEDGPVEVRTWYWLTWFPDRPDCSPEDARPRDYVFASPGWHEIRREFHGDPPGDEVQYEWSTEPRVSLGLDVQGWDKALVEAKYQQLRAEYFAQQAGG